MAVYVDVKSRFDESSGRKAAEEAKRYFADAGTSSGNDFSSNFAKAVERDDKVRAAADKVADKLDKITAAEAKRATQLEKSKAINEAVAATEAKLSVARDANNADGIAEAERALTSLREKQTDINNKLVVSSTAVSRAEREKARAVREAGDAYRKMGDDAESAMSRIGKLGDAPGGGGFLGLNAGLTGIGLLPAAATGIIEVAGAVQQLAGAGFAVPGIFAGIAASVGVGALGMHGMSDAITAVSKASDGTKSSVEAANKALEGLAPAQADVVKTVVGLKGTFDALRATASGNMFEGVSGGLKTLAAADLPAVNRGVDSVSRGINQNLLQAMRSLGSSSSQGFLDRIFGNTADAQQKLTTAIDPAIHAIGTLTAAGTDSLPRLADAVGNVADRFDRFISTADANGNIAKWIDEGLTGFTQLGESVLNIGKSFTALTQAAGGGTGLLGTLESATGRMADFLNSTQGQAKLKDFFAEGRDMLGQLRDVAVSAGPVLAGVFQSGLSAANLWLPVIKQALDTINAIPGGAAAVVGAFATWKTISGVASLATALGKIAQLLSVTLPSAAATGAGGISAALAGISVPAWLGGLLAGGSVVAVGVGSQQAADRGYKPILEGRFPERARDVQDRNTPPLDPLAGGGGPNAQRDRRGRGLPGFGASIDPNWSPVLDPTVDKPGTYRTRDGQIRTVPGTPSASTPGVSSYTAPTITESGSGSGSGSDKTPFIDPSKYMMGDPLAGAPAAVAGADPAKIYDADSKVITATHNLEQGRLALQVLEAKGNATQQELLTAKNNLVEQERALYDAQDADIKARTNQMKQSTTDLQSVFAPLDADFGASGGIPGIVKNLTTLLGDFAMAGAIRSSPTLQAAAMSMTSSGSGSGGYGFGLPGSGPGGSGAYPGDAALLANIPAGRYGREFGSDLTKGLGDCSSAVEDLVALMQGRSTAGASMTTMNEASQLSKWGLLPTNQPVPGALNVGFNGSHTQATLPGGTPFNWGSDTAARAGGVNGGGAWAPGLTSHYYLPTGAGPVGPDPTAVPWGAPGVPSMPAGAGGQGFGIGLPTPGMAGQAVGQATGPAGFSTGQQPAGGGGPGFSMSGSLADGAIGAAGALDLMAPGAGQAAQIGLKLGKRAIEFGAQAAGIGASGLMETFLPAGSPLGANSWFSKLAGGISGARPAKDNMAGTKGAAPGQAPPAMPGAQPGAQQGGPQDNSTTINVQSDPNRGAEGTGRDVAAAWHGAQTYSPPPAVGR